MYVFLNADYTQIESKYMVRTRFNYSLFTVIIRLSVALFNFLVKVVVVDRILD